MSLHTDTLPAILADAAQRPSLRLRRERGKLLLENVSTGACVDVTGIIPRSTHLMSQMPEDLMPINLLSNSSMKQLIERINPHNPIVL
jgi:hypothetical protein